MSDIEKAVDSLIIAAITYGSSPRGFNKTANENYVVMKKYKDTVMSKIEVLLKGEPQ